MPSSIGGTPSASAISRAAECLAGLDEVHILGTEAQRLPVEPAFEQQRPARVARTLEARLELPLQALALLARELPVARRR